MNIHKLKQNPKKLKKLKTTELTELFQLTNEELKLIVEKKNGVLDTEVDSWEKFIDEISDTLDSRD